MDDQDKVYSKLWQRLGLFEVWDRSLLGFAICVTALLSYAFDAVRLDDYSLGWLPVNAISFSGALLLVIAALKIAKTINIEAQYRAYFNLCLASLAMGSKNLATLYLCEYFGISDSGSPLFRFIGGAAIGAAILLIYSNFRGAKIESQLVMAQLLDKERTLRGYRENITDTFADEQQQLIEKTRGEILPRLKEIQEKVELGRDGNSLAKDLIRMISQDVKPLSASLANEAFQLKMTLPSLTDIKPSKLDVRVNLAKSIRPLSTGLLVFFAWWMLAQIVIPQVTILDVFIATIIYQIGLFLIQLLVRPVREASVDRALLFAPLPGTLAAMPSYVLFYQIPIEGATKLLLPAFLVIGGWASISFSLAYILDRGRAVAEQKLAQVINQFSRENKLFEQRLWVAQHVWYTLLHGTVQSALTAAAIRANGKTRLQEGEQDAILSDLNRAIESLRNPELVELNFEKSLSDLQETWSGICTINYDVSPEAWTALAQDANARLVTNEVLKEAVSNAVKHGQASKVKIEIALTQDRSLQIKLENNGVPPARDFAPGLGSRIFDSVCTNFEIKADGPSELTVFRATIPIA